MKEILRFRCPCCGLMPIVDSVDWEHPYPVRVYRQTIGGSERVLSIEEIQLGMPLTERGRGRPRKVKRIRGNITYDDITEKEPETSKAIIAKVEKRLRTAKRATKSE